MTEERVSIFIPTHNRRSLLQRAVKSALDQSYKDIEVIVVDDGSTDDTPDYLRDLTARDPRVIVHRNDSARGAPSARNWALKEASGFFVTGLDDDDEFHHSRVELFVSRWRQEAGKGEALACLFSESLLIEGSRSKVTADRKSEVSYSDLFRHNFIGNQIFCPREYLISIGGFDERLPAWQDLDTYIRLLRQFGCARRVDEPTYICHMDVGRNRISNDISKVRRAFEMLAENHKDVSEEWIQLLFLELFGPGYSIIPTLSDWRKLIDYGVRPEPIKKLLWASVRNRIKAIGSR